MEFSITYWLKRIIFLVLILVQVGSVYSAPEVLAGTEIEGVEVAYGHDKINAWGRANRIFPTNSKFITDVPVLESISRLSTEGSAFRTKLGTQWEVDLDVILMFARDSKCSSCGNAGMLGRSSLDQYLNDVDYFVTNFNVSPGGRGNTFLNWMRGRTNNGTATTLDMNTHIRQLDEVHQTISDFRKKGFTDANTKGFGQDFDVAKPGGSKKQYDRRSVNDEYYEYKNVDYTKTNSALIDKPQSIDQFINGYLRNIESFDKLKWKAGFDKLKKAWGSQENALVEMKKQWKQVFETHSDDIFDSIWSNEALKTSLFGNLSGNQTSSRALLDNFVKNTDNRLFKFILVE